MSELTKVGRVASPYGIKGWVKIQSYTSPPDNLFEYQPLVVDGGGQLVFEEYKAHGKSHVAKLKGVDDRTQAELFCPKDIYINKDRLPEPAVDEFYWHQLENLKVISEFEGERYCLGRVKEVISTGANDVIVVEPTDEMSPSIESRERLIPFVDSYTGDVDLNTKEMIVFWDPDF